VEMELELGAMDWFERSSCSLQQPRHCWPREDIPEPLGSKADSAGYRGSTRCDEGEPGVLGTVAPWSSMPVTRCAFKHPEAVGSALGSALR